MRRDMSAPRSNFDYDSSARLHRMLEELGDLVRFRDLLVELIGVNLKRRYKRSVFGVAWTVANPVLTMLLVSVAFAGVFRGTVAAYPVYALSGLLLWSFFAQSTAIALHGLVWEGSHYLKRVYLPRTLFSVAAIGTGAVNLLIGLMPLAALMIVLGQRPSAALLFVPVALLLTFAFVLGAALVLSAVAIYFADVIEIFQAAVMAMFYVTPVIYPAAVVPERFRWILEVNPMTHLLETFRAPIHLGTLPSSRTVAIAAAWAVGSLVVGWATFTWKTDELAYRV